MTAENNPGKVMKIGIPRALLYYQYYPMWKTFFESLGAEVVTSGPTTRQIVQMGSSHLVAETCLPAKVFTGHVESLVGKCDAIFVPAVRSIKRNEFNCSKFLGLPDMVKAAVPNCPPLIEVDIDVSKGKRELYAQIYKLGRYFTRNPLKVKKAAEAAWQANLEYIELTHRESLTIPQALEKLFHEDNKHNTNKQNNASPDINIALIGHPYMIHDDYINYCLISKLEGMRARVLTTEMASEEEIHQGLLKITDRAYWTYEDEIVGAAGHFLHSSKVDGIICLTPMACGPDSCMVKLVQLYAKRNRLRTPMVLTLDEHMAEAGLCTRIEAFVDMIRRKGLK